MKAKEFKGIIPPIQTSFTADGELNEQGIRNLIRFTLPHVHAYYPIGTYGVGPLMTLDDRKKALEIILDEVNGKVPVIAHVGCADTKSAIELAKHAKAAGASAVASISPYYSPNLPDDMLFQYHADIIDAVQDDDFYYFLYNNPNYCQNKISPNLLRRLAEHGLRGCKEASFDLVNFYQFKEAVADYPDFSMIVGTEAIFVAAYDAGADGCVCGIGNIFPEVMRKMHDQYMAGDRAGALKTQEEILKIRKIIKQGPTISIMHAILELRGVDAGWPKRPYLPMSDEMKAKIADDLKKNNLL